MNIMYKLFIIMTFSVIILSSQAVHAVENLEIVVCDGCNNNQYQDKVLSASTINDRVIVMDVLNRRVRAYYRNIETEPGFRGIYVWEDIVPDEHKVSFDEYMQIYDLINGTYSTTKIWSDIPKQLSSQGVVNATAVVQGIPFPIPNTLCTNFCVDTRTVHDVLKNLDAQRLIGLELNKTYAATNFMKFKIVIRQYFAKRPLTITVKFNDDTTVDFMLNDPNWTIPWAILPDTALDPDGKPISPSSNTVHDFNGGFGEGNYRSDKVFNDGFTLRQQCQTVFTGSRGNMVAQLVCWVMP